LTSRLRKRALEKALRFINTAKSVVSNSSALAEKGREISGLIKKDAQQTQRRRASEKAAQLKKAALAKQAIETLVEPQTLPTIAEKFDDVIPPKSTVLKKITSTDSLLVFNQIDVDNQSHTLGLELDNLSRRIIKRQSKVIIHANSEQDFRWINGSLKTYIYLLDSKFNLDSTAKIGSQETPSIELIQ